MLKVDTYKTKMSIKDQSEMENIISYLCNKGYHAIIRSMLSGIFNTDSLPEPNNDLIKNIISKSQKYQFYPMRHSNPIWGDIFISEDTIHAVGLLEKDFLNTTTISFGKQEEAIKKFGEDITEGIKEKFDGRRLRGCELEWTLSNRRYSNSEILMYPPYLTEEIDEDKQIEINSKEPDYNLEDLHASKMLIDFDIRKFIQELAKQKKMIRSDAINLAKDSTIDALISTGLVGEEYLLKCKQDQHAICIISSKNDLRKEPMASTRCSVCGNRFSEEHIQEVYTLTENGKKLIDSSLWMQIWITELLQENGIPRERIKWNIESSGEELDIMVEDYDTRFFIELKDREFGLGDSYPFIFRINRYKGKFGLIATMDKVSNDAKNFFKESDSSWDYKNSIKFLEGTESIQKGIKDIIDEITITKVRNAIKYYTFFISIDLWPVIEHWINTKNNPQLIN